MKRFEFRLQSVLQWRVSRRNAENAKLQELLAELERFRTRVAELAAAGPDAAKLLYASDRIEAGQLGALDAFRRFALSEQRRLQEAIRKCELRVEQQRKAVQKAGRDVKLLEELRDRQFREWREQRDREEESLAAEVFLANWNREAEE